MGGGVYHRGCLATTVSLLAKSARAAQAAALFALITYEGFDLGFL